MGLLDRFRGRFHSSDNPYDALRKRALDMHAEEIGLHLSSDAPIFGVVMETGTGGDTTTFLCLADGTVSLYLSTGGGVIGAGSHETVRAASDQMLRLTNKYAADYLAACDASPGRKPANGMVHFHLLTAEGPRSVECDESALKRREDAFANLYYNCHDVMAEVRKTESGQH